MGEIARNTIMVKEIKLTIDGHEYTAYLADKDACKIIKNKTGYERADRVSNYYFSDEQSIVDWNTEDGDEGDDNFYNAANYYSDKNIAKNNIRADEFIRHLRQWQALNDAPVDWNDTQTLKWFLAYDNRSKQIETLNVKSCRNLCQVYFTSQEKTKEAIETFYADLIWYFTEYQQRLDEPKHK